jgi:S1-C subfamily serine protease
MVFARVFVCAFACILATFAAMSALSQVNSAEDSAAALCPIVYPNDQTPGSRGYHYTFFGNAFFINEQGYLLTVAHVLDNFRDGGQPYILVNRPDAPPQLLRVTVIAKDLDHDVAILRATPDPFAGKYRVAFVPLAAAQAVRGEAVLALSLGPKRLQNAYSFEYEREVSSPGTVLSFESTQLNKPGPAAEVFLLSHPVEKGQSGSPVLAINSHAAVGLIEGLWLRGVTLSSARPAALPTNTSGAAIPIRYATALLPQHGIAWHSAPSPSEPASTPTAAPSTADRPEQ